MRKIYINLLIFTLLFLSFASIDTQSVSAKSIKDLDEKINDLEKEKGDIEGKKGKLDKNKEDTIAIMSEFSQPSIVTSYRLKEYGKMIYSSDAIKQIIETFH